MSRGKRRTPEELYPNGEKQCKKCGRLLSLFSFKKINQKKKDGSIYTYYLGKCKDCYRVLHKSYTTVHKEELPEVFTIDLEAIAHDYKTPLSQTLKKRNPHREYKLDFEGNKYYQCTNCEKWFPLSLRWWPRWVNNPLAKMRFGAFCKTCNKKILRARRGQGTTLPLSNEKVKHTLDDRKKYVWIIVKYLVEEGVFEFIDTATRLKNAKTRLRRILYKENPRDSYKNLCKNYEIWKWPIITTEKQAGEML